MELFVVSVVCSACGEEAEVTVEDLDDVEHEACACGYSLLVLSVAEFEPVHKKGRVIELPRRDDGLSRAA
jgi:Zn ribbon nucleic-acid-binding protein